MLRHETAALLPDILAHGLDVVFVGAAPSPMAVRTGHYYAGTRNRFWMLLYEAGFTPRPLDASEDGLVLQYGIGLTAVFPDMISTDNTALPVPTQTQRDSLTCKIRTFAPRVVCYNGKDVYRMCSQDRQASWGELPHAAGEPIGFVVHSSSGRADRWGEDRLFLYRELRSIVEGARRAAVTPLLDSPYNGETRPP